MKRKVKAFTIIELAVAMVVSAIVIMTLYTTYLLIKKQYIAQSEKAQKLDDFFLLKKTMALDFFKADSLKFDSLSNSIQSWAGSTHLEYQIGDSSIVRISDHGEDSFHVKIINLTLVYSPSTVLVNTIAFGLVPYSDSMAVFFRKEYDAKTLLTATRKI